MRYDEDRSIEINVTYLGKTEESVKVSDADERTVYLPLSAIRNKDAYDDFNSCDVGDTLTLEVGERLATNRGLL